ncbi:MAG TPA: zf-HC2 domain-containing protein [Lysobacter sp.]
MSGRVLRFEGSAHDETERLLPWFVNGTLEGDELANVQQHLAQCARCQQEVETLRQLQAACVHESRMEGSIAVVPAFARLRARIAPANAHASRSRWSDVLIGWRRAAPWLRTAVAVQSGVIVLLGIWLIATPPPAAYRTLGDAGAAASAVSDTGRLVVMFDPGIDEAQLRRLLQASGARIVDGPTAAGAYVLAVPAARVATVRDALRAAPGVALVETLEPVVGRQ